MMVESLLGKTPDSCTTCTSREFPHITANAPIIGLGEGRNDLFTVVMGDLYTSLGSTQAIVLK